MQVPEQKSASTRAWYEKSYAEQGLSAQRSYPNEELVRFLLGNFSSLSYEQRAKTSILELGTGVGGNLWMVAREGFDAHGIDISERATRLSRQTLARWEVDATLAVATMDALPYRDGSFDAVVDIFSSYCLDERAFLRCIGEVARVLAPMGSFFSFSPGKSSDAFRDHAPARLLDPSTLTGIERETSPYFGNDYPFRFVSAEEYVDAVQAQGLIVRSVETTTRTYRDRKETFEFVVITAQKPRGDQEDHD